MSASTSTVRDHIVAGANSAGDLLDKAQTADPEMFNALTGNFHKWVYAPLVVGAVTKIVTAAGLNWSAQTDDLVAAGVTLGGMFVWHWLAPKINAK